MLRGTHRRAQLPELCACFLLETEPLKCQHGDGRQQHQRTVHCECCWSLAVHLNLSALLARAERRRHCDAQPQLFRARTRHRLCELKLVCDRWWRSPIQQQRDGRARVSKLSGAIAALACRARSFAAIVGAIACPLRLWRRRQRRQWRRAQLRPGGLDFERQSAHMRVIFGQRHVHLIV